MILILTAVILLTVGTIVLVFIGYHKVASAPELLLESIKDGASLSIGKIRQTATRDGKKQWSLEASSARYLENEKKVILKELSVTFFLKNQQEVYLKADQGVLQTDTNDIEFTGNVVITKDNYKMKAASLNYENSRRVIFSHDPVNISSDSAELSGNSISYDLNSNKIVMTGKVKAAIAENFTLQ